MLLHLKSSQENLSFDNMWDGTSSDLGNYVFAFYSAFWAFSGYSNVGNIIEEIKKPLKKNVVLAVVLALSGVICIYLLGKKPLIMINLNSFPFTVPNTCDTF